jgi:hypothetical protein
MAIDEKDNFSIFSEISKAFSVILSHPRIFLGISLVSALPFAGIFLYDPAHPFVATLTALAFFVCFPAGVGAASKAVDDIQGGGPLGFGRCLKAGFSRGAAFLLLFPFLILVLTLVGLLAGLISAAFSLHARSMALPYLITFCLLSFVLSPYAAAVPAIVLERVSCFASLKRSAELTKGKYIQISLFLLLLSFLVIVTLALLFNAGSFRGVGQIMGGTFRALGGAKLLGAYLVFSTFFFASCGVLYKTCYRLTESKKVEDLANVF